MNDYLLIFILISLCKAYYSIRYEYVKFTNKTSIFKNTLKQKSTNIYSFLKL